MEADDKELSEREDDLRSATDVDRIDDGESGAEESDDELMKDDVEGGETFNAEFEAFPLNDADKDGLIDMLTQLFLRANVELCEIAKRLIDQSPFGCVFRPAEEFADDEDSVVYGTLSLIGLGGDDKFVHDIFNLLLARGQKNTLDDSVVKRLNKLYSTRNDGSVNVGLLINERMLHFPGAIAAPAFSSLKKDIQEGGSRYNFTDVIVISKIRIRDVDVKVLPVNPHEGRLKKGRKKKMGKAAKKRAAAAALAEADVIYDNSEEALLYRDPLNCPYFQYPVQSEIERESKFSIITINGVNYRPFRRVSVLDREQFTVFVNLVSNS